MKKTLTRRSFIEKGSKICVAGCCLIATRNSKTFASWVKDETSINPKELCYCGHKCPEDCKLLMASIDNNIDLKKEAYKEWSIKERFNVGFNPDDIYCFGCKNSEQSEGIVLRKCTVRSCAIEKSLESCIECNELTICEMDLWTRYPDFKKAVIEMQLKYKAVI